MASNSVAMHPVQSSQISFIGYDYTTEQLHVTFKNTGSTYAYLNVPQHVYDSLMTSSSIGKDFSSKVKDNYKYTKVN